MIRSRKVSQRSKKNIQQESLLQREFVSTIDPYLSLDKNPLKIFAIRFKPV